MKIRNPRMRGVSLLVAVAGLLFSMTSLAQTLGANLAVSGPGAGADGSGFSNTKTVRDGSISTYSQASGTSNQRVSVKWSSNVNFNTVVLKESGNNVSSWQLVNNQTGAVLATGTTIGSARTVNLGSVNMNKINLVVSGSSPLRIAEFEVYNATGTAVSSSSVSSAASSASSAANVTTTYQANLATLYKGIFDTKHSGYTGSAFIDLENVNDSYAQWTINQTSAGAATIAVRYANGTNSNRIMAIRANSGTAVNANFPGTGAWNNWSTQSVTLNLNAGNNVIRLSSTTSDGGPNIDRIEVTGGSFVASSSAAVSSSSQPASSSSAAVSSSSQPMSSSSAAVSSSSAAQSSSNSNSSAGYSGPISNDCINLATNPNVNWRQTSLQSDQAIVECLAQTLGRPVGYGENARGGYNPNGGSKLTIITKSGSKSVEEQLRDAIAGDEHNWIVFDKFEFANEHEISLHRLWCDNSAVLSRIGGTQAECINYRQWCSNRGYNNHGTCMEEFFNNRLNQSSLPIRVLPIGSNTTIDGRMSNAYLRFMGFTIGRDSSGASIQQSNSVIVTHLNFQGAGHTEDHAIDPDMVRSTGESHDIWIHKNTFDLTGDSAFDVKVGAYNITMSFNKLMDVQRAALHGSSDSRTINAQITTTMHHNAFVTRDNLYEYFAKGGRRVPLIRRGTTHMFNNVFMNYRKDILSIRVGARVLWEDNMFVVNEALRVKSTLEAELNEMQSILIRDISGGSFRADGVKLWAADSACNLDDANQRDIVAANGSVPNLALQYSTVSRNTINANKVDAGQELVDYVSATAGHAGAIPFNSPLAGDLYYVLGMGKVSCQ